MIICFVASFLYDVMLLFGKTIIRYEGLRLEDASFAFEPSWNSLDLNILN